MQQQKRGEDAPDSSSDTTLFDRHGHTIFAYLRLHIASREDAEDLTLEVFMAAWEHDNLSGLQPEVQLAWLRRVAHNKLVDRYRRLARRPVVGLEDVSDVLYDDEARAPEQVALRHEEFGQLHRAIAKLSPLQQQVLQLRYANGLGFADIALLLDKREEAVRKLLSRTLALLRTIYSQR